MKRLLWLLAVGFALAVAGCSDKDDSGDGPVNPNTSVSDPAGTIQLSMRKEGEGGTWLGCVRIGKDDNFELSYYNDRIASLGAMKGLGNVATIPFSGWASKVAVVPGNGYVVYDGSRDDYYRIYVTEYITGATSGGIIGADVKYQRPFEGHDEAITVDKKKVVLPAEGGAEQVLFGNKTMIPFTVTSSEDWCVVRRASTHSESFLYDAVEISCAESYSAQEDKATVTIETLAGKTTEIEVTRAPRGAFITLSQDELSMGFSTSEKQNTLSLFTNIDPADIKVTSSADWLSGVFSARAGAPERSVQWVEGEAASRATLDSPVSKNFIVTVSGYAGVDDREGTITFTGENVTSTLRVVQNGSGFSLAKYDFAFEAEGTLSEEVSMGGRIDYNYLWYKVEDDAKWLSVSFGRKNWGDGYMTVSVQPNPYEESRSAVVKIKYLPYGMPDYEPMAMDVAEIVVTQKGMQPYDRYIYFESPASNATISFPIYDDAVITSSADWCTATPSGSNLVIRATATTADRSAVITVKGSKSKIYVSQSKYKVGDKYDENGVTGDVYSMKDGIGRIIKALDGGYVWSVENVDIQGATDKDDGLANTDAIKAIPGWQELYPAFAAVDALNVDGVSGWYLPAKNEYSSGFGWRSTQANATQAYYDSYDGYYTQKNQRYSVIAMHRFSYDFTEE